MHAHRGGSPSTHQGAQLMLAPFGSLSAFGQFYDTPTTSTWIDYQNQEKGPPFLGNFVPKLIILHSLLRLNDFLCFLGGATISGWSSMHASGGSSPPVIRLWSLGHSLSLMIIYAVTPWIQCYILLLIFIRVFVLWSGLSRLLYLYSILLNRRSHRLSLWRQMKAGPSQWRQQSGGSL